MPRRGQYQARVTIGDPSDPQGMAVLRDQYLEWMRIKNYSPRTVDARETYLNYFIVWGEQRGLFRPSEITKPILDRYRRSLYYYRKKDGKPLSFRSQYSHLVALRPFFKWLTKENFLLYNPASELDLPKLEKRLPKYVLSESEVDQVINLTDVNTALGIRDRAILETLYSTGMRRMEVTNLDVFNLDMDRGTVMIRQGKGRKDRMVPIGERATAWIDKYLADVRPTLVTEPDHGALFLTYLGDRFTPNCMSQLAHDYIAKAALGKTGSCHLFRHTMATLMLEHGADIRYIQAMLGHRDLSTTEIYTQVSIRKLKQIHTATHPAKMTRSAAS